jgi:hypothetical protein
MRVYIALADGVGMVIMYFPRCGRQRNSGPQTGKEQTWRCSRILKENTHATTLTELLANKAMGVKDQVYGGGGAV